MLHNSGTIATDGPYNEQDKTRPRLIQQNDLMVPAIAEGLNL